MTTIFTLTAINKSTGATLIKTFDNSLLARTSLDNMADVYDLKLTYKSDSLKCYAGGCLSLTMQQHTVEADVNLTMLDNVAS